MTAANRDRYDSNSGNRFKALLLELHRGAVPSSLFEEFHEVIRRASEQESAEIQKQLVIEGVPTELVEEWCRSHIGRGIN